jgi:hypothetical protein
MAHLRIFAGVGEGKPCMCTGFMPKSYAPLGSSAKLPKPEDGIEAKREGRVMCVAHEWLDEKPCPWCIGYYPPSAPKLELKGEGGALESTEELPPLDDQTEARMKVMNDHPSFPSEAWEILAHCRERQLKQCMSQKNQLIHTVANLSGKIAKLSFESLSADVPIEERTAEEVTEEDDAYGIPEGRQCVCWGTPGCEVCGGSGDLADAKPVPERTAEMERLFKKVIMATYDLWDSDQDSKVGKRLRALVGLLPGYDRDIDTLLDHIEGKAKC